MRGFPFLPKLNDVSLCVCYDIFIYSPTERALGGFRALAVADNAAVDVGVQKALADPWGWLLESSGCTGLRSSVHKGSLSSVSSPTLVNL